jgi:hypothetical protein
MIICLFLAVNCAVFSATSEHGSAPGIWAENNFAVTEDFRIRIVNTVQGEIKISTSNGRSWFSIGKVVAPSIKTNDKGYTASKWSRIGSVSATAVNAIHIKVGTNVTGDHGVIFSLLPKDMLQAPRHYTSYLSPDASIYTNIPAGLGIFGGGYAPFVGSPLYLEQADGTLRFLPVNYKPELKDIIVIKVLRPLVMPSEIVFENRFGGPITIKYQDGMTKVIGQVLRPVSGVGRFLGSQYAYVGRIRANHSGVLDISTTTPGHFGGFQIVPANHGMSREMINARVLSQWMVVGPPNVGEPSWENTGPLYSYFLKPSYAKKDLQAGDWMQKLSRRYLVEVKYRGRLEEEWGFFRNIHFLLEKPLPDIAGKSLEDIAQIRILLPVYPDAWPE